MGPGLIPPRRDATGPASGMQLEPHSRVFPQINHWLLGAAGGAGNLVSWSPLELEDISESPNCLLRAPQPVESSETQDPPISCSRGV